jgi:hypothetical protein
MPPAGRKAGNARYPNGLTMRPPRGRESRTSCGGSAETPRRRGRPALGHRAPLTPGPGAPRFTRVEPGRQSQPVGVPRNAPGGFCCELLPTAKLLTVSAPDLRLAAASKGANTCSFGSPAARVSARRGLPWSSRAGDDGPRRSPPDLFGRSTPFFVRVIVPVPPTGPRHTANVSTFAPGSEWRRAAIPAAPGRQDAGPQELELVDAGPEPVVRSGGTATARGDGPKARQRTVHVVAAGLRA